MLLDITNTIYEKLLSSSEKLKFRIMDDRLIYGGSELTDTEFQESYVYEINKEFYPFIFITLQIDENKWMGRYISFEYDMYRLLWICENNKKCLNALQEYQGIILN